MKCFSEEEEESEVNQRETVRERERERGVGRIIPCSSAVQLNGRRNPFRFLLSSKIMMMKEKR